ncbi:hypothetical protein NHB13_13355 [Delftia tsuruhatensis]|nr:hypothetical protein [Delftia tsuruhatensis]
MTTDIDSRISRLRARRSGEPGMASLTKSTAGYGGYAQDSAVVEDWERRGTPSQKWTRYAIGAMQAVSEKYTEVSKRTGERVANQLSNRLAARGIPSVFRLQGSVPLNVHIKGVSDVDVLTLRTDFLTYNTYGARALKGIYSSSTSRTSKEVLRELRQCVEYDLERAFPEAEVNKNSGKAVKISGGSLARSVDVVPSHWDDNARYQISEREADRGVTVYDKKTGQTVDNLPFVHIDRIASRCDSIGGGLRKAIRLCKNVKSDSSRSIQLSSYDISAIMYYADMNALRVGYYTDLVILAETQRHLDHLFRNQEEADKLFVPDETRKIFDSPEKRSSLLALSLEIDELFTLVFLENYPNFASDSYGISFRREMLKYVSF